MAPGIPNFGDGSRTIKVGCDFFPAPYFIIYDFTENPALRQDMPGLRHGSTEQVQERVH